MSKKREELKKEPTVAPGMDDQEELEQSASKKDIRNGDYTRVTTLSFDEVDPS